jgi:hypothetical protein
MQGAISCRFLEHLSQRDVGTFSNASGFAPLRSAADTIYAHAHAGECA